MKFRNEIDPKNVGTDLTGFKMVGGQGLEPWAPGLVMPVLICLIILGGRSSLGHRPANISTASFSNNHLVNEITLNSTYTLLYAVYRRTKHEENPSKICGKMKRKEIFELVRHEARIPEADYVESEVPFAHKQVSPFDRKRPLNVVIFLQESLGARFVGSLGA
jgi:phosphoglycerol transferase MdoB-like AlkP superfamily enzyme